MFIFSLVAHKHKLQLHIIDLLSRIQYRIVHFETQFSRLFHGYIAITEQINFLIVC